MTASAGSEQTRTLLLIDRNSRRMFPMNSEALSYGQASSYRKLRARNVGALIFDEDGSLRSIEKIDVLGVAGGTWLQKVLGFLSRSWRISVHLSDPQSYALEDLKKIIIDFMPASAEDMNLEGPDDLRLVIEAVGSVETFAELFSVLKLPKPEDALDIL